MPVEELLVYLLSKASERCLWLWRGLVCWIAFLLESGPLWGAASVDDTDIPAPRGPRRARRLNPRLLNALATMAGQGKLARTGSKAAATLRFALKRRGLLQGVKDSKANEAQLDRAKRYRDSAKEDFHVSKVRVLSVASDASRVGNRDIMVSSLYSPETDLACWGDPMVRMTERNITKVPFLRMSKSV